MEKMKSNSYIHVLTNQRHLFFGIFVPAVLNTSTDAHKFWIGLTNLRKFANIHPVEAKFDSPQAFLFFCKVDRKRKMSCCWDIDGASEYIH